MIKNKKSILGSKAPMTVEQCLALSSQKIEQFTFDETEDDFDAKKFYNSSIADYECLLCGVYEQSSRGFELSFEKDLEVALNKKIIEGFLNAENPIAAFSTFYKEIQYLDAFSANQMFFEDKNTKQIIGMYALTQDVETILPYKPNVEYKNINIVKNEDVNAWKVALMIINGAPDDKDSYQQAGEVEYSDFIARLPKDKYRFIDANYIIVTALTQEDILNIVRKN